MKESFEDCSFSSIIPNFFNENSGLEDATIISIELEERTIEQQQITDNSILNDNNITVVNENLNETSSHIVTSEEYQYNLHVGDNFDDWESVDTFIHQYCLERGFGDQVFRNDKDSKDHSIIRRKSYRCSLSGKYLGRKNIDQNSHRIRNSNKSDCKWHCNFKLPKTEQTIRCTTLVNVHNHELIPGQIEHLNSRYRQFSDDMMQDLRFFTDCNVAPITQLEILKKKYPNHVFHKQDVYNAIYKLHEKCDEILDSGSLLNVLLEKIIQDPNWKIFVRHSGNERRLSGIFWMSPSQQDLYRQFHDVVLNDNTCKTNKYNMYLSKFMVKDNCGKF